MPADIVPTPLTDARYRALTGAVLASVEATVDAWLQDDVVDIDTQRSGGLLELGFPNGSKIVLNTQPPLQELWLAARSGGFHYKHVDGRWLDTRDGRDFFDALSACASEQAGRPLGFVPPGRYLRRGEASSAPEEVEDAVALFLVRRCRQLVFQADAAHAGAV